MFDDIIKERSKYTIYCFTCDVQTIIEKYKFEPRDSKTLNSIYHHLYTLFKELQHQKKIKNAIVVQMDSIGMVVKVNMEDRHWQICRFPF